MRAGTLPERLFRRGVSRLANHFHDPYNFNLPLGSPAQPTLLAGQARQAPVLCAYPLAVHRGRRGSPSFYFEMSVHIFTARLQAATRFRDDCTDKPFICRRNPRKQIYSWCCRKKRWAKYLQVQVFYDSIRFWCKDGQGCKKK